MDRDTTTLPNSNGKGVVAPGSGDHGSGSSSSSSCLVNSNHNAAMMHHHHAPPPSSAFGSVFSNSSDNPVQDLDNTFSRMSLYNGGSSVVNNNNGINSNYGVNYGREQLYSIMLPRSTFSNRDQTLASTPFYGSASSFNPLAQNGSSSSAVMDQYVRFRSMNSPFHPTDHLHHHHHLLQSNSLFYPPRQPSSPRTASQFDHEHFPQLERYPNGRHHNGRRNCSASRMYHHNADQLIDAYNHQSNVSFADLRGNLVNYAMDQNGCRILQNMFEKVGREEFDILFEEVICYITQLMMDQYGNFIFQKLVQICSVDQRTQIVATITRDPFLLVNICLNSYGTRAVQKLLMYLTTREQKGMILAAISPGVFDMSKDGNAHHVIVYCIKNFPYELNKVFLNQMVQYCFELSTDQSGCCVVQSCVDHSRGEGRDRLVREILSVAQLLSEDRFGNYVVQCLLRQMDQVINMRVWEKLKGNFTSLSCNKFGSNVVEACLEQSDRSHVDLIILEMLENPHVSTLFSDAFGNYVTQVALSVSKGSVHEALVREIQKHAPSLQSNQYGKMTLSWFDPKKRRRSMNNRTKYGQFHP